MASRGDEVIVLGCDVTDSDARTLMLDFEAVLDSHGQIPLVKSTWSMTGIDDQLRVGYGECCLSSRRHENNELIPSKGEVCLMTSQAYQG
jgi:hypothetical protein